MIPNQLNYSNIKPKGWYTRFKQWPLQPNTSNVYWQNNQIVRFLFQLQNGVLDPYRSHIQAQVQVFSNDVPVGGLVMDVSAQSLISQLVITSNARQVQRIVDYDVISAYLYDMGFSQYVCQNRQWQGMGYDLQATKRRRQDIAYPASNVISYTASGLVANCFPMVQTSMAGCISPTKTCSQVSMGLGSFLIGNGVPGYNGIAGGSVSQHISSTNTVLRNNSVSPQLSTTSGKINNIRHQYQPQVTLGQYIDSTTSCVTNNPLLPIGVIPTTWNTQQTMPSNLTYATYFPSTLPVSYVSSNGTAAASMNINVPNQCGLLGYHKPYSSSFSRGMNQPMISPTIPQCQISYGQILDAPIPVSKKVFKIPLVSSVLGVLIPVDQFLLIPLQALNNTLIELTLNPYAMYSTGCMDVHQLDSQGMKKQIPRKYFITNIIYNLHLYDFPDQQITGHIQASLTKQIVVTSTTWIQSSQYQIPNGNIVKNNWQVNTSSQSMAQLVCLFISNQYLKYSYCRKQFRLSNNITSYQIKFNLQYYPPQPIVGNAGNPQMLDNTGNNSPFLQMLLLSNNYLFTTNIPQPKINMYNFSLNKRIYDPSNNVLPLYNPAIYNQGTSKTTWSSADVNSDVAMGQSYFHQNRHRGMAAYTFSFQPYGHSKQFMTGVDTRNVRPFDVLFDCASTNPFTQDQTLYIFCRSHVVVSYGKNGITVYGR